jgi:hypothetical protein
MMTHVGKIGRLAKVRREELGRRIEDGQPGKELVKWLNSLPDVRAVLAEKFGGRAISESNLTVWKGSGHLQWLWREEAREGTKELIADSNRLDDEAEDWSLGERLGTVMAAAMNGLAMALLSEEPDRKKRWKHFREVHREVSRLRRDDYRAKRLVLEQERWDRELEKQGVVMERVKRCQEESQVQSPRSKVGEKAVEMAVNQGKFNQIEAEVQSPKSEVQSLGQQVEAGPGGGTPPELAGGDACGTQGFEIEDEDENEEEGEGNVQSPKSEVQSQEAGAGEGRGMFGKGIKNGEMGMKHGGGGRKNEELRMKNGEDEAGSAKSVNSEAGEPAEPFLWPTTAYVPDPNPEVEAYNRWWRMNRNYEKFDYEELQRIYAELPQKMAEYNARLICEAAGNVECVEGAGI